MTDTPEKTEKVDTPQCAAEYTGTARLTPRARGDKILEYKTVLEYCEAIGWSLRGLADLLECNDRTVRRWADGTNATPPEVLIWLDRIAKVHEKYPAPDGWRTKSNPDS